MALRPEDYTRTRLSLSLQRGHLEQVKTDLFSAQASLGLIREGWQHEGFVDLSLRRNMPAGAGWLTPKKGANSDRDIRINARAAAAARSLLTVLLEEVWLSYGPMLSSAELPSPLDYPAVQQRMTLDLNPSVALPVPHGHWFSLSSSGALLRKFEISYWANFNEKRGRWIWALPAPGRPELRRPPQAFEAPLAEFIKMAMAIAGLGQPLPSTGP